MLPEGIAPCDMGAQGPQGPRRGVELKGQMLRIQPPRPVAHHQAQRVLLDDPVQDLGVVNRKVGRQVHGSLSANQASG